MILRKWEDLPAEMQIPEVKEYYDLLSKKKFQLAMKRIFDIVVSFLLPAVLCDKFSLPEDCPGDGPGSPSVQYGKGAVHPLLRNFRPPPPQRSYLYKIYRHNGRSNAHLCR